MTDHQNTRHINITTDSNRLNLQQLPFTRGSGGASQKLNVALNCANILDRSRNFDYYRAAESEMKS